MSGKVILYILILLLGAFLVSMIFVFTREDPQEIYRRNSNLRVEVLNGCGVKRLAIKVANILRQNGFNVIQIGNAHRSDFEESVIIERSDNSLKNAKYFARRTKIKNIGSDVDPALHIDVTLILGADYKKLFPDVEKEF